LCKKFWNENSEVIEHINLMALQKIVYISLKMDAELARIDHSYRICKHDYARAWQIMNDIEVHEAVLDDTQKHLKKLVNQ
jgi:hypothetical protein